MSRSLPSPKKYFMTLAEKNGELVGPRPDGLGENEGGILQALEGLGDIRMDRLGFLKLMGFSFGGLMLSGCTGKTAEKAIPYLVQPDDIIPGVSNYYATVCGACSAACGVLSKNRDGRPLMLQGNPEHPLNRGGLCAMGLASVLGVYDTARLKGPRLEGKDCTWDVLDNSLLQDLEKLGRSKAKVRLLSHSVLSPTLRAAIHGFLARFPQAQHIIYDPLSASAILAAHALTHGARLLPYYRFERAEVIASFNADFLGTWISPVEFSLNYTQGRHLDGAKTRFSRHIHAESALSLTGSKADERWSLRPSEMPVLLGHLGLRLGLELPVLKHLGPCPVDVSRLDLLAHDLLGAKGKSLVVCGDNDLNSQLLVNAINHQLGNYGATLDLVNPSLQRQGDDTQVAHLLTELEQGQVDALFVLDADPVYELPEGAALKDWIKKVPVTVSFAGAPDETGAVCRYAAPDHHFLEAWGDAEPRAGLLGLQQPVIRPMANTRQALESLTRWSGKKTQPLQLLRTHWMARKLTGSGKGHGSKRFWERSLMLGFAEGLPEGVLGAKAYKTPVIKTLPKAAEELELLIYAKIAIQDGRQAVNPWLQEMPDPISKITWDHYASVGPDLAKLRDWKEGDVVKLSLAGNGLVLELPLHIQVGQNKNTVAVAQGYGRLGTERFSEQGPKWLLAKPTVEKGHRLGVNVAPWMTRNDSALKSHRAGLILSGMGRNVELACTQRYQSLSVPDNLAPQSGARQPIVKEGTLVQYLDDKLPDTVEEGSAESMYAPHKYLGHRWAMVIDLSACNGCAACVVACQIENNIPVVGRDEVVRAREMHWMRIDRYYAEGPLGLETVNEPMLCQQCEEAPCEPVCPVAASVHSSEGLNQQVYNRCVGTRYCENNCPYKVRRFNWFDYPHADLSENLALNPDVTVRSRGVMEKCTFCVQRIQSAKAVAIRDGVPLKDGDIRTACQQTCPSKAIVFGDMNDPESEVSKMMKDSRAFKVLAELNVKPSVTYLAQIRNREEKS